MRLNKYLILTTALLQMITTLHGKEFLGFKQTPLRSPLSPAFASSFGPGAVGSMFRSAQNLQRATAHQGFIPIEETGFFTVKTGYQTWSIFLFVNDQPIKIPALNIKVLWNAKTYLDVVQTGDGPVADLETNAVAGYSHPGWYSEANNPFQIAAGFVFYSDGNGGFTYYLSSFSHVSILRSNNPQREYQPSGTPYFIASYTMKDGNYYQGWLTQPKAFFHVFVSTENASSRGLDYSIVTNYPMKHRNFHIVDIDEDGVEDFQDYRAMWDHYNNSQYVLNLSMYQFTYDPRFDVDEDAFMNFLDLRALGKRLNDGNYVADVDGDGDADPEDILLIDAQIGRALFLPGGGYDVYYPWECDINGDLVISDDDLIAAELEVQARKVYFSIKD